MEIRLLNENKRVLKIIESCSSMLWNTKYNSYGDCELYMPVDMDIFDLINEDDDAILYLARDDSDTGMIIESCVISTSLEEGDAMTIKGKSLESLLYRRIIWNVTKVNRSFQEGIKTIIEENVINPSNAERKIESFIFEETDDPIIADIDLEKQWTGDNLGEAIEEACLLNNIGFKVVFDDYYNFIFSLYYGGDRSSFIEFSEEFDSIVGSDYTNDMSDYKNVALVAGEDSGEARKKEVVGEASGIRRRELFVDARDIQSEVDEEHTLTPAEYKKELQYRGEEKLQDCKPIKEFNGDANMYSTFIFNRDYFLGDIVTFKNKYGIERNCRVIECLESDDADGYVASPVFEVIEEV